MDSNIHNLAIKSDFDFCQHVVKSLLKDSDMLGPECPLVAVNSINWCRIMVQIVYYFYCATHLGSPARPLQFAVPTGNLGDIFAGYIANKMGLPIEKLVIATNENDILDRFLKSNVYERSNIKHTLSPSMDIQVSSNFERLLFDVYEQDANTVKTLMEDFRDGKNMELSEEAFNRIRRLFASHRSDDDETVKLMRKIYEETGELIDPHTATGIAAAQEHFSDPAIPMITLATAHPAKFPEAAKKAGLPISPLPPHLADLYEREERYEVLPQDIEVIQDYMKKAAGK